MTINPSQPATEPQPRTLSFAKYFWLSAAIVAIPVLILFDFFGVIGAALLIGLAAALVGGGIAALLARRAGKPVWVALLWAAVGGLALSAPIVWVLDLILAANAGTADQPRFTPAMFLWALPLPLIWSIAATIARPRETATS